jgi:hypothetical protein
MQRKSLERAMEDATQSIRAYLVNESTSHLRAAARDVVEIRSRMTTGDGRPDWGGRSSGYRRAIAEILQAAGVPAESRQGVQSGIRYHLGNALRERLTADELRDAGMSHLAPKERMRGRKAAVVAVAESVGVTAGSLEGNPPRVLARAAALLEYAARQSDLDALAKEEQVAARLHLDDVDTYVSELRSHPALSRRHRRSQ